MKGLSLLAGALLLSAAVVATSTGADASVSTLLSQKSTSAAEQLVQTAQENGHVRVIVEFGAPAEAQSLAPDSPELDSVKAQISSAQDAIIGAHLGGAGFTRGLTRFEITPMFAANVSAAELEALAQDPRVLRIHEDELSRPMLDDSLPLIGMPAAYSSGGTGSSRAVAILDTGIQRNHKFFGNTKVIAEACFSNAGGSDQSLCPNGQQSQTGTGASEATIPACMIGGSNICDHGPHVAGIAAGLNTNRSAGEPASGVARSARIVSIQVFTRFNTSFDCGGGPVPCVRTWNSDQIRALEWIFQNAINLPGGVRTASANMSLGGGQNFSACDTDPRKPAIDALRNAGVATVIASGNDGFTNSISSPACISTAVSVGSASKLDTISSFSNSHSLVDLLAPGSGPPTSIRSAVPGNMFANFPGTSMAAPHVAGAFAAIRSACPAIPNTAAGNNQILNALRSTGLPIADTRSGGVHTKNRIRVAQAINQLNCGSVPDPVGLQVVADFDGDGRSDILWRHTGGQINQWLMHANTIGASLGVRNVPNTWRVKGVGDFNGNGRSDILLHNSSNGNVAIYFMNRNSISLGAVIGQVNPVWDVAGVGDFDGDGRADILWRHPNGQVNMWLVNGTNVQSRAVRHVPNVWQVAGVGDFNGNGRSDILWRHNNGTAALYLMNAHYVQQFVSIGTVNPVWDIVGVGDFDGDGHSDILWRHPNGQVNTWMINGGKLSGSFAVRNVPTVWNVATIGDFDGNGQSDILWRRNDGAVAVYLMNGHVVRSGTVVGSAGTVWSVVNDGQPQAGFGASASAGGSAEAAMQPVSLSE